MKSETLISDIRQILLNTNNPKVQEYFYKFSKNQDIVILDISNEDIERFTKIMLNRFNKYITGE